MKIMENVNNLIPFPLSVTSMVFGVLPWGSFKNLSGKLSSLYTGILLIIFSSSVMLFAWKCANASTNNANRKSLKEIRKLWIDYLMQVYPAIRIVNSLPAFYISFICMERVYSKIIKFIHISDVMMGYGKFDTTFNRKQFWYGLIIYLLIAVAICPFKAVMLLNISKELLKSLNLTTLLLFPVSYFGNFAVICVEMQFACICRAIYLRLALINLRLKTLIDEVRTRRLSVLLDVPSSQIVKSELDRKVVFVNRYFSKSEKVKILWKKLKMNRRKAMSKVLPMLVNCAPKTNFSFQDDHDLLKELISLRLSYRHLHLCLKSVQDMFGIHLLFSFCSLFIMIVFFIYFEFYHKQSESKIFHFFYLICGWLLHLILRFNLLLWQAYQTTQEAEKIEEILPLAMGRQLDQSVKDELQMFSIEVSCSDWKITGWNFFVLKPELFVWTVGGVATYLGIIVNLDVNSSN
ncbi:uncharacterized protein LOC120349424 [Nilaparvata lugens]|uniref:uncharacterized protein LOC120349424 n=1 Tax=Nilaparvata lugens TaxID=108931 RepID=UPI00193EB125|nr:uncharacterized protein LOC120349424 [Nilaparvata lugens]